MNVSEYLALRDRFLRLCLKEVVSGCWLWRGNIHKEGYGRFHVNGCKQLAHRVSYELFRGRIPEGMQIDHLCRVRFCVNPNHLEVVTGRENTLRGEGICAKWAKQTHCLHGHEYTPENTYMYGRWRYCRECARLRRLGIRLPAAVATGTPG